jgi:hypothetical protein
LLDNEEESIMSDQSLLLPAENATTSSGRERRIWARYPASIEGICQPVAAETATEPEMGWPGEIVDISSGGIALSLGRRFQPGTPLVIELPSANDEPSRFLQVRIIHAKPDPNGQWIHGCEMRIQLSDEDLQAFL